MKRFVCLAVAMVLGSCGGGGGDGGSNTGANTNTNSAPTFTSPSSANVMENQGAVAYGASAADANNDSLTYSVSGGADRNAFAIDARTGALSFVNAPDFEAAGDADGDNVYEVVIRVQDPRGASDTLAVAVSVEDDLSDNGFPVFTSADSASVPENQTSTGYQAEAEDPDGTIDSITISGGADQGLFAIDAQTGSLSFLAPKDFESPEDSDADNQYVVQLQATDDEGKQAVLAVTVTVTNVNQLSAEILFPTANANVGVGKNTSVTVTARLTDPEDGILEANEAIVNGYHLSVDANDPSFWAGLVPLAPGDNELSLIATGTDNVTATATRTVTNILPIADLNALVIDPTNQYVYLTHPALHAIQRLNMVTKQPEVVSTDFTPTDFVFSADGVRAFALEHGLVRITELNVTTGATRVVYDSGSGDELNLPRRLDIDEIRNRLIVLDHSGTGLNEIDRLVAVDITTGARTVISDETTGSGPQLLFPQNLAIDPPLGLAYVVNQDLDSNSDSLISIGLFDGTRNVVSSDSVGLGTMPAGPRAVALTAGTAYLVDYAGTVTTIDLDTGDKALLADGVQDHIGGGGGEDVAFDAANHRLLTTDTARHKVWAIDTQTGVRTVFYETPTGTGPGLETARSLYFDDDRDRLLVLSQNDALIEVDLASANRSTIADDAVGSGPTNFGVGIAADLENDRVFVPAGGNTMLRLDLATGDRTELSGPNVGFGLPMMFIRSPVFDKQNGRILVLEGYPDHRITAIDIASGARSIFSDMNTGTGPQLDSPLEMVLDEAGNRLIVTQNTGPLLAVDLSTGDRSVFSGDGVGNGDPITTSLGIALDSANGRVFVSSLATVSIIDLDTGDRTQFQTASNGVDSDFESLAWDADRNVVYSTDAAIGGIVAKEISSNDNVIVSK